MDFRHWFQKQAGSWEVGDPSVRDFTLAVLSCALGPLLHQDIERIVAKGLNDPSIRIRSVIDLLRRFIIGDGVASGYAFQHPKFAEYFLNEHFRGEFVVSRAETAIRQWCSETVAAIAQGKSSTRVPHYVFNHYVGHLIQDDAPASAFLDLTTAPWLGVCKKLDFELATLRLANAENMRVRTRETGRGRLGRSSCSAFLRTDIKLDPNFGTRRAMERGRRPNYYPPAYLYPVRKSAHASEHA